MQVLATVKFLRKRAAYCHQNNQKRPKTILIYIACVLCGSRLISVRLCIMWHITNVDLTLRSCHIYRYKFGANFTGNFLIYCIVALQAFRCTASNLNKHSTVLLQSVQLRSQVFWLCYTYWEPNISSLTYLRCWLFFLLLLWRHSFSLELYQPESLRVACTAM